MDPARLRLFVAVLAPPPVQRAVAVAQGAVRAGVRAAGGGDGALRFGDPSDAHVTLLFLGATPAERVEALAAALAPVAAAHAPFLLRTDGFGAFPSIGRARVAWMGLAGDSDALERLHRSVVAALRPFGYEPEQERFTAHLTLGRVRDRATSVQKRAVASALRTCEPRDAGDWPVAWPVDAVHLMASETRADGPRYRSVGRWALGPGA